MPQIFRGFVAVIIGAYIFGVSVMTPYYNWEYAKKSGFRDWLLLGSITSTAKAFAWPYFVTRSTPSPLTAATFPAEKGRMESELRRQCEDDFVRGEQWTRNVKLAAATEFCSCFAKEALKSFTIQQYQNSISPLNQSEANVIGVKCALAK